MIAVIEYINGVPQSGDNWMILDEDLETWQKRFRGIGTLVAAAHHVGEPDLQFFRFLSTGEKERIFAVDLKPRAQEC
jgi:hypothetical protein